ncbi:hypothetical protein WICMUC_005091 [Wickerhamomyces mucosus]|uniref:Uncharacterized protein n=1 Tax=Wickerhamomyces mucosus TaxID=1378264 RepID=A0A9P8PC28_9ASCO|nr:hypothetical protein WICMUC_005091 [Wickerhamomyces mucosus]
MSIQSLRKKHYSRFIGIFKDSTENRPTVSCTFIDDSKVSDFRSCDPKFFYLHDQKQDKNFLFSPSLKYFEERTLSDIKHTDSDKTLDILSFMAKVKRTNSYFTTNYQMFVAKDPKMSVDELVQKCRNLILKLKDFLLSENVGKVTVLPDELNDMVQFPSNKDFKMMEENEKRLNFLKIFTHDLNDSASKKQKLDGEEYLQILIELNEFLSGMLAEPNGVKAIEISFFQKFDYYKVGFNPLVAVFSDGANLKDSIILVPIHSRRYFTHTLVKLFVGLKTSKNYKYPIESKIDIVQFNPYKLVFPEYSDLK